MGKSTSVSLGAGLRLLEEEETRVLTLKKAIQEGLESGIAINFDPSKHLQSLKSERKANG